jgi:hypothetical protein
MLIDIAREEKGYKIALLQPSPKAVPLYERVGFKKVESTKERKVFVNVRYIPVIKRLLVNSLIVYMNHSKKLLIFLIILVLIFLKYFFFTK